MRNDDPPSRPAASGCPPAQGIGRRIAAWALHGPPWTYVALAAGGLLAALVLAGLKG